MPRQASTWVAGQGTERAVALEVLLNGPVSRNQIAQKLGLSRGSLTRLTAPLIEQNLLIELDDQLDGRAGRPSRPLDVVADSRHFIGVKVTTFEVMAILADLRANVIDSRTVPLQSTDPASVARVLARVIDELREGVREITAVGIGLGGLIADKSEVLSSPFLEWTGVPFAALVGDLVDLPVVVENDVAAFTEAEHWFGHGRGFDAFAVLTLGAGIGYGLVQHDALVMNDDFGLGLIGHWPIDPTGPLCPSGHRGCAHSLISQWGIQTQARETFGREMPYDEVLDSALRGDPAARRIVDDAGRGLGRVIAAVANLTMPARIVLGGEGVRLVDIAHDAIADGIGLDRDPRAGALDIVTLGPDNLAWCRGAAVIAIQTYVLDRAGAGPARA